MAVWPREAMGSQSLQAFADRGYFNGPEIKACEDAGIAVFVPKPMTSNAKAEGRFDKSDFIYIAQDDEYQCPAGERAIYRFSTVENGLALRRLLDECLPSLPDEATVHDQQLSPHPSLGTRRGAGAGSAAA